MQFYCTARLSDRMSETPEGFLVCRDVAITRTGELEYMHYETPLARDAAGITIVERTEEDVFDPETIASFEGKPLTLEHPTKFVTPDTWRKLAVGHLHNVRRGSADQQNKLVSDLIFTAPEAIKAVKDRTMREVSCGYDAEYVQTAPGRGRQTKIRGNHLALVPRGRAGPECAIFDSAPIPQGSKMTFKEKLLAAFSKTLDSVPEDGEEETIDSLKAKLAKLQGEKTVAEQQASDSKAQVSKLTADVAKLTADVATVSGERDSLKNATQPAKVTHDAATVSLAEILAPGIAKDSADLKVAALKKAYASADGKAAIEDVTGGGEPAYDQVPTVDATFRAAAAILSAKRKAAMANPQGNPGNQGQGNDAAVPFCDRWAKKAAEAFPLQRL